MRKNIQVVGCSATKSEITFGFRDAGKLILIPGTLTPVHDSDMTDNVQYNTM